MTAGRVEGGQGEAGRATGGAALLPYLLIALSSLFWSGNWVIGRFLRDALPPVAFNFWRWGLAALILAPFVLRSMRGRWWIVTRYWRILAMLGITGASLFQTLVYLGLETTTTVNAVLLNASTPPFIMLWAWLIDRETVTPRQIAGVVLAVVGILVIVTRGELAQLLELRFNRGDLLITAAMPIWGLYSVLLKRRPAALTGLELIFVTALFGLAFLLPLLIIEGIVVGLPAITATSAAGIAYVAVFASLLAYICYNKGVEAVGAHVAGFMNPLLPGFATILAILLLGEQFRLFHLVGFALLLGGMALSMIGRRGGPDAPPD
jgi:drug/metabolite transporter (DMT)-like permease